MKPLALFAALLSLLLLSPPVHAVTEVETGAVTQPFSGLYYNPTGVVIGSYLYIYAQGINPECQTALGKQQGDVIDAFRAPLQADGTPGTFTKIGRISPCVVYPSNPSILASFGPGQIFKATWKGTTAYHLVADMSDFSHFFEIWHGWTTDGLNWTWEVTGQPNCSAGQTCADPVTPGGLARTITWKGVSQPLLSIDPAVGRLIVNPVLLSNQPSGNNAEWWGYLKYWDGQFNTMAMRVLFDTNGNPTVYLQTTTTPSFQYAPLSNNRITSASQLLPLIPNFNAKSLLYDNQEAGYQLWGSSTVAGIYEQWVGCASGYTTDSVVTCQGNFNFGCPPGGGCVIFGSCQPIGTQAVAFDSNTYQAQAGSTFYWYDVTRWQISGQQWVGSYSRYMPSGYVGARDFPFRWNASNGKRFLFSATSDAGVCSQFVALPYIVKSEVIRQ